MRVECNKKYVKWRCSEFKKEMRDKKLVVSNNNEYVLIREWRLSMVFDVWRLIV
jgi:hypothetical protein